MKHVSVLVHGFLLQNLQDLGHLFIAGLGAEDDEAVDVAFLHIAALLAVGAGDGRQIDVVVSREIVGEVGDDAVLIQGGLVVGVIGKELLPVGVVGDPFGALMAVVVPLIVVVAQAVDVADLAGGEFAGHVGAAGARVGGDEFGIDQSVLVPFAQQLQGFLGLGGVRP